MPTVDLKVADASWDNSAGEVLPSAGVPLRPNGDTDYLCGNGDFVIAVGMRPTRVSMDGTTCPACGVETEFPPELHS
jgi:hypothetical protein